MDYKRAALLTLAMYITSFFIGMLAEPYFAYTYSTQKMPIEIFLFGLAMSIVLTILFTKWYFKGASTKPGSYSGALFGLFIVGFTLFIDIIFILPALFTSNVLANVIAYYLHPMFWVTATSIPVAAGVTGAYISKNEISSKPKSPPRKKTPKMKKKK